MTIDALMNAYVALWHESWRAYVGFIYHKKIKTLKGFIGIFFY